MLNTNNSKPVAEKVSKRSGWKNITASVTGAIAALGMTTTPEASAAEPKSLKAPTTQEVNLQVSPTLHAYNPQTGLYYIPRAGEKVPLFQVTFNTRTGTIVDAKPYTNAAQGQGVGGKIVSIGTVVTNAASNFMKNTMSGTGKVLGSIGQSNTSQTTHSTSPVQSRSADDILNKLTQEMNGKELLGPKRLSLAREAYRKIVVEKGGREKVKNAAELEKWLSLDENGTGIKK